MTQQASRRLSEKDVCSAEDLARACVRSKGTHTWMWVAETRVVACRIIGQTGKRMDNEANYSFGLCRFY